MPDLDKLQFILTIENANMLRINPELLESTQNQDSEQVNTDNDALAWLHHQVEHMDCIIL